MVRPTTKAASEMADTLLTEADKKEELSRVYARAVAAVAGYVTEVPDLDRQRRPSD